MEKCFEVAGLEVERLLAKWQWLCPALLTLVARNVFGELFLQDQTGSVFWLSTTTGKLDRISKSHSEFRELAETAEKRQEWFVEKETTEYAQLGLAAGVVSVLALVCLRYSPRAEPLRRRLLPTSMSMFPFWETFTDKSPACQIEVRCACGSVLQNLGRKAGFDGRSRKPQFEPQ